MTIQRKATRWIRSSVTELFQLLTFLCVVMHSLLSLRVSMENFDLHVKPFSNLTLSFQANIVYKRLEDYGIFISIKLVDLLIMTVKYATTQLFNDNAKCYCVFRACQKNRLQVLTVKKTRHALIVKHDYAIISLFHHSTLSYHTFTWLKKSAIDNIGFDLRRLESRTHEAS